MGQWVKVSGRIRHDNGISFARAVRFGRRYTIVFSPMGMCQTWGCPQHIALESEKTCKREAADSSKGSELSAEESVRAGQGGEQAWLGVLNRPPPTPVPPTAPTPTTYGMTYLAYRVTGALCLAAQTLGSGKTFLT